MTAGSAVMLTATYVVWLDITCSWLYFMYCGQSGYFLNKPRILVCHPEDGRRINWDMSVNSHIWQTYFIDVNLLVCYGIRHWLTGLHTADTPCVVPTLCPTLLSVMSPSPLAPVLMDNHPWRPTNSIPPAPTYRHTTICPQSRVATVRHWTKMYMFKCTNGTGCLAGRAVR
jgi:hypothetical protein